MSAPSFLTSTSSAKDPAMKSPHDPVPGGSGGDSRGSVDERTPAPAAALDGHSESNGAEGGHGSHQIPMIGNINSPSVSLHSVSSDGSTESHVVEPEEMVALTQELKRLKEALGRLRKVFAPEKDRRETRRVASHERLGEVLRILRQMLEKYPVLQSNEIVSSAEHLINEVSYD